MINYNPKAWFDLIFHNYSKHVLQSLLPAIAVMVVYTLLIAGLFDFFEIGTEEFASTIGMHSLLGIVLGLFLVFRTNSAYDRWWEGRKMWGNLVNSSRNLALKLNAYVSKEDHQSRTWYADMIANFAIATKEHVRRGVQVNELTAVSTGFEEILKRYKHKPNYLAGLLYNRINEQYIQGTFTGNQFLNLDKELKDLVDIMGACERIRYTPIPYSYSMYIKKFIFIYLVTLPFGFITTYQYFTMLIVAIVTFVLLSIELIAEEIEDPFGHDINDLPTDELAEKIKESVKEILEA